MTNRDRIVLLVWSRDDYRFFPPGSLRSSRGLTPARKAPCPDCSLAGETVKGAGWVTDRFKRREPCLTCGGTLEPRRKGRGWVKLDAMDVERQAVQAVDASAAPTRPVRMVDCDKCGGTGLGLPHLDEHGREYRDRDCPVCGGEGKRAKPSFQLEVAGERDGAAPVDAAIDRRNDAGSYHELDVALDALGKRETARLTRWASVVCDRGDLNAPTPAALIGALAFVETQMPDPIVVPGAVRQAVKRARDKRAKAVGAGAGKQALAKRDREIRGHARQGRPAQWLAAEYGVSLRSVYEIVNGREAA